MRANFNISVAGIAVLIAFIFGSLAASATVAQERAVIPNFFDPQDRFEKPDLTALPRLRFLTVTDFPPFSYVDGDKMLVGYHIELARALCNRLGLEAKCEIQALPFADLEAALAAGEGEALLAGIAITPQSRERLAFTRPYFRLPARFAGRERGELDLTKPVAVRKGTAHAAYLARFFPTATVLSFDTDELAVAAVEKGEASYLFADALRLTRVMSGARAASWRFVGGAYGDPAYFGRGLAIAVRPDDVELLAALNQALVDLNEKRVLEELYLRHFPIGLY